MSPALLELSSSHGVGRVLVDEMGFKILFVAERPWTEGAVEMLTVGAGELVLMGPADFCGDE
jgi:hypothetical protein